MHSFAGSTLLTMPSPPSSPRYVEDDAFCIVAGLSQQMSQHSLQHDRRPWTPAALPTPPNELELSTSPDEMSPAPSPFLTSTFSHTADPISPIFDLEAQQSLIPPHAQSTSHSYASSTRRSRQDAVRAQCSSSHLHKISLLVARMVESGEQCRICSSDQPPSNTGSEADDDTREDEQSDVECELDMDTQDRMDESVRPDGSYSQSSEGNSSRLAKCSESGSKSRSRISKSGHRQSSRRKPLRKSY